MRRALQLLRIAMAGCALFCTARVACGQTNVYSVNAVGYVIRGFSPGYNFFCNPLQTTNNTLTSLFRSAPDSCAVYLWDEDAQKFSVPAVYHNGWSSNYTLAVGRGFVLFTPNAYTNAFVGEVLQGHLVNPIAGSNRLSLVSSMVPQAGPLSLLEVPATDGDSVYMPKLSTQSLSDGYSYFSGYGWFDPLGVVDTNGPVLPVASCFFVRHAGSDTNWVRDFYVNNAGTTKAKIQNIQWTGTTATLSISVPKGAIYSVQTSPDRIAWTTAATNQTASVWTSKVFGQQVAYFRLR